MLIESSNLLGASENRRYTEDPGATSVFGTAVWHETFSEHVAGKDWRVVGSDLGCGAYPVLFYAAPDRPRVLLSYNNYYASFFDIPEDVTKLAALVRDLGAIQPTATTLICEPFVRGEALARFKVALSAGGWFCREFPKAGNWYLPSDGVRYAAYLEDIKSRTKNPVNRKTKVFFKDPKNRVEVIADETDAARGAEIFRAIYEKSWRTGESHPEFVSAWILACAKQKWLRLGVAWHGEVAVAAQFWFVRNGKAHIYKMAYDDAYPDLSAGTVLSGMMFQHVLDVDQVTEVDYLSGDDEYKKNWVSHRREMVGIEAFNLRTVKGQILASRARIAETRVAQRIRQLLASRSVTAYRSGTIYL